MPPVVFWWNLLTFSIFCHAFRSLVSVCLALLVSSVKWFVKSVAHSRRTIFCKISQHSVGSFQSFPQFLWSSNHTFSRLQRIWFTVPLSIAAPTATRSRISSLSVASAKLMRICRIPRLLLSYLRLQPVLCQSLHTGTVWLTVQL